MDQARVHPLQSYLQSLAPGNAENKPIYEENIRVVLERGSHRINHQEELLLTDFLTLCPEESRGL